METQRSENITGAALGWNNATFGKEKRVWFLTERLSGPLNESVKQN